MHPDVGPRGRFNKYVRRRQKSQWRASGLCGCFGRILCYFGSFLSNRVQLLGMNPPALLAHEQGGSLFRATFIELKTLES